MVLSQWRKIALENHKWDFTGWSKMTSLPNCIEVDQAKPTNTQDIADDFNIHFSTFAKNRLAQNQPS